MRAHEERHVWGNATDAFFTREEAEEALADVLRDEPSWERLLSVVPIELAAGDSLN